MSFACEIIEMFSYTEMKMRERGESEERVSKEISSLIGRIASKHHDYLDIDWDSRPLTTTYVFEDNSYIVFEDSTYIGWGDEW